MKTDVDYLLAEALASRDSFKFRLESLLAVIHRDGGHYTESHGLERSCKDAETAVLQYMTKAPGTPGKTEVGS